jgi:hypothetical protein
LRVRPVTIPGPPSPVFGPDDGRPPVCVPRADGVDRGVDTEVIPRGVAAGSRVMRPRLRRLGSPRPLRPACDTPLRTSARRCVTVDSGAQRCRAWSPGPSLSRFARRPIHSRAPPAVPRISPVARSPFSRQFPRRCLAGQLLDPGARIGRRWRRFQHRPSVGRTGRRTDSSTHWRTCAFRGRRRTADSPSLTCECARGTPPRCTSTRTPTRRSTCSRAN